MYPDELTDYQRRFRLMPPENLPKTSQPEMASRVLQTRDICGGFATALVSASRESA